MKERRGVVAVLAFHHEGPRVRRWIRADEFVQGKPVQVAVSVLRVDIERQALPGERESVALAVETEGLHVRFAEAKVSAGVCAKRLHDARTHVASKAFVSVDKHVGPVAGTHSRLEARGENAEGKAYGVHLDALALFELSDETL